MPDLRYLGPSDIFAYPPYTFARVGADPAVAAAHGVTPGNVVTVPTDVGTTLLAYPGESFQDVTAGVPASPPPPVAYATEAAPGPDPQEPPVSVPAETAPDPIEPPASLGAEVEPGP